MHTRITRAIIKVFLLFFHLISNIFQSFCDILKSSWLSFELSSGSFSVISCVECVCHIREEKLEVTFVRLFAGIITRPREKKNRERGVMATWHRRCFFILLFVYIRPPSHLHTHTLGSQEDTDRSNRAPTRAPMVPTLFGSGTLQR